MEARAQVTITGTVQRVGYRAWTARTAQTLGLRGWVKNEPDGTVTAVFVGPRQSVEAMVGRCREGSPASLVDDVQASYGAPREDEVFEGFRIDA